MNLAHGQIVFEETTSQTGISYVGPSFGVSWGDMNADGWPDVWLGSHGETPRIYINQRDGSFAPFGSLEAFGGDNHGVAWADFDNDGDQDLLVLNGGGSGEGSDANKLLVNDGASLTDLAFEFGIDYPFGRGRTPLWFDWNQDGNLDVFVANWQRPDGQSPSAIFTNFEDSFVAQNGLTGISTLRNNQFAQLGWRASVNRPILMIHDHSYPESIYEYDTLPFSNVTTEFDFSSSGAGGFAYMRDVAYGDFNKDGQEDYFIVRSGPFSAIEVNGTQLLGNLTVSRDEKGVSFSTTGEITVTFDPPWLAGPEVIHIGASGYQPDSSTITLSASDPENHGIYPHSPGVDYGVYIGYEPVTQTWKVLGSRDRWFGLLMTLDSTQPISNATPIGFVSSNGSREDRYFVSFGDEIFEVAAAAGLGDPSPCEGVATADFDNDRDLDLYLVCPGAILNVPNRLYENTGNGGFVAVPNAGGAAGSGNGRGESVAVADYDQDGFVDLFVTNGRGDPPFGAGPDQIFRNVGNQNNWLQIDLEGVESNRDGIGARVQAVSDNVTQVRLQDGGMHRFSQDYQRLHFGLANSDHVDELRIEWPSGITQALTDVPVNQVIRIVEPVAPVLKGRPSFVAGQDSGVFIWKDAFDGPYRIRANGAGPKEIYTLDLIASRDFEEVVPVGIEAQDSLSIGANNLTLSALVSVADDGVDVDIPSAAQATLAVRGDGYPNPRQVHVGSTGRRLSPRGWTVAASGLPPRPGFVSGQDLGLFLGWDGPENVLEARWNGDGQRHFSEYRLLSSAPLIQVTPVGFEGNDSLQIDGYELSVTGLISTGWDGLDVLADTDTRMAVLYSQDQLFQSHRVNQGDLGLPDTYLLPRAEPNGQPLYNPAVQAGLFVWKDSDGIWQVRGSAGGGNATYRGTVTSDQPVLEFVPIALEGSDSVVVTSPTTITFTMSMAQIWEDGFAFDYPDGAQITLNLDFGAGPLRIGQEQWPVDSVPLDLSGWE